MKTRSLTGYITGKKVVVFEKVAQSKQQVVIHTNPFIGKKSLHR